MLVLDDLGYGLGTFCWAGRPGRAGIAFYFFFFLELGEGVLDVD